MLNKNTTVTHEEINRNSKSNSANKEEKTARLTDLNMTNFQCYKLPACLD
ncbi:hypothetical protein KDAU_66330 [Dictyobacter aurantiacus]|uniref:Uncharacterized protein n=1 Tax=Dictyobacter aurantiacus TaxID=1936993 RepID=A0A401ZR89_9CHLR|nr:hypothetical protein KDAU_66330 [Dictyobacter aurantiacus]